MSFIRIKNNSVILATSYRKDGKVKQDQRYLGKVEERNVPQHKLNRICSWIWELKEFLENNVDNIDSYKRRSSLAEFRYQTAIKKTDKLFHIIGELVKKDRDSEILSVNSKELYGIALLAEEIGDYYSPASSRTEGILEEVFKLLDKPYLPLTPSVRFCPTCGKRCNKLNTL